MIDSNENIEFTTGTWGTRKLQLTNPNLNKTSAQIGKLKNNYNYRKSLSLDNALLQIITHGSQLLEYVVNRHILHGCWLSNEILWFGPIMIFP